MQFENKIVLYFLFIIPILVMIFYSYVQWRKKALERMGDVLLINKLMDRTSLKRKWIKFVLLAGACVFIILGLANLRLGSKKAKITGESAEIMICFDVSNSMLAEDVKPNRMVQAKLAAVQLVEKLAANKIGLIVFAGDSYVQMPLTSDARATLMYLNNINTGTIGNQGTAIGNAIETAIQAFANGGDAANKKGKAIIIITDGESHDANAVEMAKKAADADIKIITLGVGTSAGGPIPIRKGNMVDGFKKDKSGSVVLTKLNEPMLKNLAECANGIYMNLNMGKKVTQDVYAEINALDKTENDDYTFTEYANHFQLFLAIGLILLTIELFMSDKKPLWLEKVNLFDEKK